MLYFSCLQAASQRGRTAIGASTTESNRRLVYNNQEWGSRPVRPCAKSCLEKHCAATRLERSHWAPAAKIKPNQQNSNKYVLAWTCKVRQKNADHYILLFFSLYVRNKEVSLLMGELSSTSCHECYGKASVTPCVDTCQFKRPAWGQVT